MGIVRKIFIFSMLICIFRGLMVSAQSLPARSVREGVSPDAESSYRDSVYRRIIMEGGESIDCHLSYRVGSSVILPSYEGNSEELRRLEAFLRATLSDTLIHIKSISVTGYGSIDGSYVRNEELSRARSEGFVLYLRLHYPRLSSYSLRTLHVAEDWDGLRALISSSSLKEKNRILSIIDKASVFDGRERQLMELSGGDLYRELKQNYFPLLRRVQVKVEYDLQKVMEEHYQVKIAQKDFAAVLEREKRRLSTAGPAADTLQASKEVEVKPLAPVAKVDSIVRLKEEVPVKQEPVPLPVPRSAPGLFKPVFAVKTNLLYLAGYSAELKKKYLTPNLELEYFPFPHWSVSGEWVYSVTDTQGADAHVWSPSSLSLEPRYWFFDSSGEHRWLYIGIYGLMGEFDELLNDVLDDGHTGSYHEGGFSLGCYIPLGSRLGLEVGARLGYRSVDGDRYYYSDPHYYYKDSYTESSLKATGFRVSVSYRFGKQYSPRK